MRTDFDNLQDGDRVMLYPNGANPIHKHPTAATYSGGYFYCDGSDPMDGPDYYFRDVSTYNVGFDLLPGLKCWAALTTETEHGNQVL